MTLHIQHDRLAQLLMKSDPTLGLDAARIQLERAAITISVGGATQTTWGQAALLTIAECAVRSFRGGVYLQGDFDEPVCIGNLMPMPLRRMLLAAGCRSEEPPAHAISIYVGVDGETKKGRLCCWTDGWVANVGPSVPPHEPRDGNELSGALAGAMIVTEAFRMTALADLVAGKRTQRLSPLTPQNPEPTGINLDLLPSGMWVLGLGNLGQALLWVLGLLPYTDPKAVQFFTTWIPAVLKIRTYRFAQSRAGLAAKKCERQPRGRSSKDFKPLLPSCHSAPTACVMNPRNQVLPLLV